MSGFWFGRVLVTPTRLRAKSIRLAFSLPILLTATVVALGQPENSGEALLEAARQQHREGQLEEAVGFYQRALPKLEQSNDLDKLATALNGLSVANISLGHYEEAGDQALRSMEIRRRLGDVGGEAIAMVNLGLARYYLADYAEALRNYRGALELDIQLDDPESQVLDLNNIGNVYFVLGDYWAALTSYQRAMGLVDQHPDQPWAPYEKNNTLANLAALQQKLGRHQLALELYSQLDQGVLEAEERAQVLINLGVLYRHLGDPYKAIETYRQAQQVFRREKSTDGQIQVLKNIGIAYALDLGNLAAAVTVFREALDLAVATSNRRESMQARLYIAETLRRLDQHESAQREFERVQEAALELGTDEELWKALYGLARLALVQGDVERGRTLLERAVVRVESLRSRLRAASIGSRFLAGKEEVYRALIDLQWARLEREDNAPLRTDIDALLQLLEKAWAEPFRDRFWQNLESRQKGEAAAELRRLRREISQLQLRQLRPSAQASTLSAEISALESQYLTLEVELRSQLPGMVTDPPTLLGIQQMLDSDELLLVFWRSSDAIRAIVISSETVSLQRTPLDDGGRESLLTCAQRLATAGSEWNAPCRRAGELLLWPLLGTIETRKAAQLIVLNDPELSMLPLDALPLPEGRLAVEIYSIAYTPTLSLRPSASGGIAAPWTYTLAAFADPETATDPGLLDESDWGRLTFARQEVEQAARLLPGSSRVFEGGEATKAAWLQTVRRSPTVVHMATHAVSDSEAPERSRILLSRDAPDQSSDYLFLGEAVGLSYTGIDLIVLSACETAVRARDVPGGPESFAFAFLMGGAASVLATQWQVNDRASAELMEFFYQALGSGLSRGEALRRAKRNLLDQGGPYSHPYYWAGYLLFGESSAPLPLPWRGKRILTLILLAAALAAAVVASRKVRTRPTV